MTEVCDRGSLFIERGRLMPASSRHTTHMVLRLFFFRKLSDGGNLTWTSIVRGVDESFFFIAKTDIVVDTKNRT